MRSFAGLLAATAVAAPSLARACTVCGAGPDRSNLAFLISTIFLSLLPILAIAGGVLWLRAKARQVRAAESEDRDGRRLTTDAAPALAGTPQPAEAR